MNRLLSIIGVVITILYVAAIDLLFDVRIEQVRTLKPNEIGDFLAGVFGPLSILWLILGFFQQGIELRQNTRALELQAEELRNSVEQQKQLVDVSRRQVEAELEVIHIERERQLAAARPKFVFHGVSGIFNGMEGTYSSRIKNIGNTATDIHFTYDPPMKMSSLTIVFSWSRGEERQIDWGYTTPMAEKITVLTISYVDSMGFSGEQRFKLLPVFGNLHTTVEVIADGG